jgi:transglutaminase-like putative cysteine protease
MHGMSVTSLSVPLFRSLTFCFCVAASLPSANAKEPAAAALAFTSSDPLVLRARGLMDKGRFHDAELLLKENTVADNRASQAREELAEIIRRTRLEYCVTKEALLKRVQERIPDATPKELDQWIQEATPRTRLIDGQTFYFSGEPKNIFLFSTGAKARLARSGPKKESGWQLTKHLADVIAEAEKSGHAEVAPVKHRFSHKLTIDANAPELKRGSLVRVWLPYPQEYRQQRDVKLISASPEPKTIAPSARERNPVSGGPQRTIYFEQRVEDVAKPLVFQEVVEYTSYAYYPQLEPGRVEPLPAGWGDACLDERLPHIAFAPEIRKEVKKIVGAETNALVKAQKIFRWVSANIPWNSEDEYCTIPSFALKGFHARRGDCGIQNTVFITMCRIAGVPARWQSGYETKPLKDDWGMHDWAEIYVAPWGWLPADASYGVKKSADPRIQDFYCGHQDSYRLIVNLDWGRDLIPPKQSLRSEPADFQRGEVEVDGKNLYYDRWSSKTEVVREPVAPAS